MSKRRPRAQVARQLQGAVSDLTKTSLYRMEREMPWFSELSAEQRAWIGMVLQAGFNSFIAWYRNPGDSPPPLAVEVFGNAPRSFAGVVTLQQTVAMVRLSMEVAEADMEQSVAAEDAAEVRESLLRYGRELAFATADVYAHAAEMRGGWDARLEALVVDALLRGDPEDTVRSRASALGWQEHGHVAVVVGTAPAGGAGQESVVDQVRAAAREAGWAALGAVHGDRLVVVVGGVSDPDKVGAALAGCFGPGPVVVGPLAADVQHAHRSAVEAMAGLRAAAGWPSAPGPVTSDDLLAERALDGDELAGDELVEHVWAPLAAAGSGLLDTLAAFLDQGGSIEGTARVLFVHPNTVRYRLRRVLDVTGLAPGDAHQAFTLRVALVLGRLRASTPQQPPSSRDPAGD